MQYVYTEPSQGEGWSTVNRGIALSMSEAAWETRRKAFIHGKTKVGACIWDGERIYAGCNLEHIYRTRDIHAEHAAIVNMITRGGKRIVAILVVAERDNFTPCGSCMDWIFQHGGPKTLVGKQNKRQGKITWYRAKDLMPHYPS